MSRAILCFAKKLLKLSFRYSSKKEAKKIRSIKGIFGVPNPKRNIPSRKVPNNI